MSMYGVYKLLLGGIYILDSLSLAHRSAAGIKILLFIPMRASSGLFTVWTVDGHLSTSVSALGA